MVPKTGKKENMENNYKLTNVWLNGHCNVNVTLSVCKEHVLDDHHKCSISIIYVKHRYQYR